MIGNSFSLQVWQVSELCRGLIDQLTDFCYDCDMKVLVAVKRVVDYHVKVRVKSDGSGVDINNVKMSMNPFDEIAIEEAVRMKEAGLATEVVAVTIGADACQETLRMALALGADSAILVQTDEQLQPLAVAKCLQKIVEQQSPQLVLFGKQAIDDDCNQTGQMLAGLMDWPQATFASKIDLDAATATVSREVDAGLEIIKVQLPAVITTDLRLNEPRYPTMPNIMKSKSKPLTVIKAVELEIDLAPRLKVLSTAAPEARKPGVKVSSINELIDKVHVESKVI